MPSRIAIVDPDGYLERDIKIAEASLPLWLSESGLNELNGKMAALMPRYYDDAGTYADRGSVFTISRNLADPNGFQPTMWINVSGKGDNATFKGVVAGQFLARDRTDVTPLSKGVLYALQAVVAPKYDRNNVPFDDVVGLSIVNQGTGIGTDGIYFGNNRADRATNPSGKDFSNLIQIDAKSDSILRSVASHDVGISFGGATFSTTAMRLPNGASISWNDVNGVLQHALRMSAGGTLRLLEGGLDIRADKTLYTAQKLVLPNNIALRAIKGGGGTTESDLIKLDANDALQLYAGALQIFSSGDLAIANNKGLQARSAGGGAYLELLRLTGSENLTLYGNRATILSGGAITIQDRTGIPATPTGGISLYSESGRLRYKDSAGKIHGLTEGPMDAKTYGAKGDAKKFTTGGAITAGQNVLTLTGATFTAADVGKLIYVLGAGAAGAVLSTTIAAFTNATTVTLAANAGTTVSNQSVIYGTDDTAAINSILNLMQNGTNNELLLPFGSYLVDTLYVKNNAVIRGQQRGSWAYDFPERSTRLLAKPGMTGPAVITDFSGTQVGNVRLFDFTIDGNKAFQTAAKHGILLTDSTLSADSLWTIERVYVGYVSGDGCVLGAYRRANRINDSHFFQCAGHGMRLEGTDNSIIQTVFGQNGLNGIMLNQGANHFYGCDIFVNTGHGVEMAPFGRMNQFTNCFFDTNLKSGVYTVAKNLSLVQCRFMSNSQEADGLYPDIDIVGGPRACVITNPTFYTEVGMVKLPHSAIRATGNSPSNPVIVTGFSWDTSLTTFRNAAYVDGPVRVSGGDTSYLKSPNGTTYRLTVGDDGALTTTAV